MIKKGVGFSILLSRRRLRDYKNYIKPERRFSPNIWHKVKEFSDKKKIVALLIDNIKIQENLVWDKHDSELKGYVDLRDIDLNHAALPKVTKVARRVLVFCFG